jgi:hypothetical protein
VQHVYCLYWPYCTRALAATARSGPTQHDHEHGARAAAAARGAAAREAEPEAEMDDVPALLDAIAAQDRTSTSWTCSQSRN